MMRKIFLILFGITSSLSGKQHDYVPDVFTEERYRHIWTRKPFSPPTAPTLKPQAEGIEQQYALSGLLKIDDKWTAFVQDRKSLKRHYISEAVNEIGLQLVSVKESTASEPATVTIRAGQQTGVIRFDPAVMKRAEDSLQRIAPKESAPHKPESSAASPAPLSNSDQRPRSPVQTLHPLDFKR